MSGGEAWPLKITLGDGGRRLTIIFDNGETIALSSVSLRLATPSVEAKRLSDEERKAAIGEGPVRIIALEAVGNYAIRPSFDDGHSTGIYSWAYLMELAKKA